MRAFFFVRLGLRRIFYRICALSHDRCARLEQQQLRRRSRRFQHARPIDAGRNGERLLAAPDLRVKRIALLDRLVLRSRCFHCADGDLPFLRLHDHRDPGRILPEQPHRAVRRIQRPRAGGGYDVDHRVKACAHRTLRFACAFVHAGLQICREHRARLILRGQRQNNVRFRKKHVHRALRQFDRLGRRCGRFERVQLDLLWLRDAKHDRPALRLDELPGKAHRRNAKPDEHDRRDEHGPYAKGWFFHFVCTPFVCT